MTDGLPSPIVDFVAPTTWYTLQVGLGNMLKTLVTITAGGATTLAASPTTYTDVYVDAPAAVSITLPLKATLFEGQEWLFKDTSGNASANPITLLGNSYQIDADSSFVINNNYGNIVLVWNGTGFSVKI